MQDALKKAAAVRALDFVEPDSILGVGTGSTVNHLIDALIDQSVPIASAVASSEATAARLKAGGIPVIDLNVAGPLDLYIDGADEINAAGQMIKGGGGALTREKIIASAASQICCIVDDSKQVKILGKDFPVPVEVIPMARSVVARRLVMLGGDPVYREGFVTDNGNIILDVLGLKITDPAEWERTLNQIPGVVCNGVFAEQKATTVIVAGAEGVTVESV